MTDNDGDYVCSLDEASLRKAREELNEDPENRLGAVETLREWVLQQKYINCPTDTAFLLRFLRARKFSQLQSRTLLEIYLARRQTLKHWFLDLDPGGPSLQESVGKGIILVLPGRDKEGRKVIITRFGRVDVKVKPEHFLRMMACVLEMLSLDETTQVNGIVQIVDFTGMTVKQRTHIPIEDKKNFIQAWQKSFPLRTKSINLYNCGTFIEFLLMVVKMAMSDKMQKRTLTHTSLDTLYKIVPMEMWPEEYLPDDYNGPTGGTVQQIIDSMKRQLSHPDIVQRMKYLTRREFTADLSQKPADVPQASFRKLTIN